MFYLEEGKNADLLWDKMHPRDFIGTVDGQDTVEIFNAGCSGA